MLNRLFAFPRYGARRLLGNLCLLILFLASGARADDRIVILALGDSLTAGYGLPAEAGLVPQLQAWLDARGVPARLENGGVSGDTTAGALARLDWSLGAQTDAVIVTLGGNDMLRGLPVDEAAANLGAIVKTARDRGAEVLIVPMQAPLNYGPDYKSAFEALYPALAAEHGALLAEPFFAPLAEVLSDPARLPEVMQPDAIHPNAEGVRRIVETLGPRVAELAILVQDKRAKAAPVTP